MSTARRRHPSASENPADSLEQAFGEYFEAIERSGSDRCYLCRRTAAEVKAFFGFREDGTPRDAAAHGLEDVVLESMEVMSYRGERPVCAVCQLNADAISILGEDHVLEELGRQMREERDRLWPPDDAGPAADR